MGSHIRREETNEWQNEEGDKNHHGWPGVCLTKSYINEPFVGILKHTVHTWMMTATHST